MKNSKLENRPLGVAPPRALLVTGKTVPVYNQEIPLTLNTVCPEKWLLIDCSTAKLYSWTDNNTVAQNDKETLKLLKEIALIRCDDLKTKY